MTLWHTGVRDAEKRRLMAAVAQQVEGAAVGVEAERLGEWVDGDTSSGFDVPEHTSGT